MRQKMQKDYAKKYEREVNTLTKVELAALKKATTAWDNRQDILFQKKFQGQEYYALFLIEIS